MIVLTMKSFFFSEADSYSLRRKPYISLFFFFFGREMIKVEYAMFAFVIEDLEVHLGNSNLPLR